MRNPLELLSYRAGWKAWVAVTGLLLWAWIALHALGLLGAFAGAPAIDGYAAALHAHPGLLWAMRVGLFTVAALHVTGSLYLARRAREATRGRNRAVRYRAASLPSRSMRAGGVLLLGFIVLHVLHMTTGTLHPDFVPGHVYRNLARGLASPLVACGYVVAALVLALHALHGLWSAPRSLGLGEDHGLARTPRAPRSWSLSSALVALALAAGFAAVPVAVLAGVLR